MRASARIARVRSWLVVGVPAVVSALIVSTPVRAQWRGTVVESIRATAEIVAPPAQFGPLVATLVEASASPLVSSYSPALQSPAEAGRPPPSGAAIAVEALTVLEGPPMAPSPSALPGRQGAPSTFQEGVPLTLPGGPGEVSRSYLVAALGASGLPSWAPDRLAEASGAAPASRAMIQIYDGQSGRMVVVPYPGGVGDGRLSITVVFN